MSGGENEVQQRMEYVRRWVADMTPGQRARIASYILHDVGVTWDAVCVFLASMDREDRETFRSHVARATM